MRLGIALASLALLGACSEAELEEARADLGCGAIDGLKQLSRNKPDFIIVGEFTETTEAPAAFAELACNLAASGEPLFVGVSEYLGGATDAESRMRARLDALKTAGAPIIVAVIDNGTRENDTRARTRSEKKWADAIAGQVKTSGASQALILVPHTDARNASWPRGERFAGYDPMPMHLDGEVLSLEIGSTPATGLKAPAIRLYPEKTNGFSGQVALANLTRPVVAVMTPDPNGRSLATSNGQIMTVPGHGSQVFPSAISMNEIAALVRPGTTREQKIAVVEAFIEAQYANDPDRPDNPPSRKQLRPPARRLAEALVNELEKRDNR